MRKTERAYHVGRGNYPEGEGWENIGEIASSNGFPFIMFRELSANEDYFNYKLVLKKGYSLKNSNYWVSHNILDGYFLHSEIIMEKDPILFRNLVMEERL